jgi:hypothetical protein
MDHRVGRLKQVDVIMQFKKSSTRGQSQIAPQFLNLMVGDILASRLKGWLILGSMPRATYLNADQ